MWFILYFWFPVWYQLIEEAIEILSNISVIMILNLDSYKDLDLDFFPLKKYSKIDENATKMPSYTLFFVS